MENCVRKHRPLVSIIIPCKTIDDYTRRCVRKCESLLENKEIIVVTDEECPGYPAAKRNWAMERAKGTIYAFIDSDAYPSKTWLEFALQKLYYFPAVCGPGVLPPDAPFMEKVADRVFQWLPYSYRVVPRKARWVAEYPTFNLIVNKKYAVKFENYLTGEDSLFCREIGGVYYDPKILVFHNRREAFKPLWKQVGTYGRHRGNFIRIALVAWISSVFTYAVNFVRGLLIRRPS